MNLLNINFWKTEQTCNAPFDSCWNSINSCSRAEPGDRCCTTSLPLWGERSIKCPPHTLIFSTPVSYRGTWNKFIIFFCLFVLNSILRKRLNLFNVVSPPIPLQVFSISSLIFTRFVGISLY